MRTPTSGGREAQGVVAMPETRAGTAVAVVSSDVIAGQLVYVILERITMYYEL